MAGFAFVDLSAGFSLVFGLGGADSICLSTASNFGDSSGGVGLGVEVVMPYVQRNFLGVVTGLFAVAQPGYGEEFLQDDHPEVVDFLSKQPPLPADFLKPITEDQQRKNEASHALAVEENQQLRNLTLSYLGQWAELETACSALFYVIVNSGPKSSKIAYAIYYALGGFDARIGVLHQSILQLFEETPGLQRTAKSWGAIYDELKAVKGVRNKVAHGTILTIHSGGRQITRLAAPPFDPINIGRPLAKGPEVGMSPEQLARHLRCLPIATEALDGMNRLIADFREFGEGPLPQRLAELDALRSHLGNPRKETPNSAKP